MPSVLLSQLEQQRAQLQRQIAQLGDLRAGSITPTGGRCGNPHCHCHQPKDRGHGPDYRLTRKVEGKTVTETLASPAALHKAQHEVSEYHRFRSLSQALLEVSEKICGRLPRPPRRRKKNGRSHAERSRPGSRPAFAGGL